MSAGNLAGDAATGCVWGEDPGGTRYGLALPRGWTATIDPVALRDPDGRVAFEEGDFLSGATQRFPWESGPVLCGIEAAEETVRFRVLHPPT